MQRIPQRLVVAVVVIAALVALVVTGNIDGNAVLPVVVSILAAFGVGHEVAQARSR